MQHGFWYSPCSYGYKLRSLDLRSAPNLETLLCIKLVDLVMQDKLKYPNLFDIALTTLNFLPASNLEELSLCACHHVEELHIDSETPNLKFLNLSYSSVRIIHLGPSPNLELLSLKECINLEEFYMSVGSVKLKSLNLHGCAKLTTLNLWPSLNLEKLDIDGSYDMVELHMPPKLKSLSLIRCGLSTLDLAHVQKLEELIIKHCLNLEEVIMPVGSLELRSLNLLHCDKLKTLNLWPSLNLEKLDILGSNDLVELQMPPKLKSLSLKRCGLSTLDFAQVQKLEEIIIKDCLNLVAVIMPVECLELRSLNLRGCAKLKTLNLWPSLNLEKLDIDGSNDLVELHMPPQLKSLSLIRCGLSTLDLARVWKLEEIIIKDCLKLAEVIMPVGSLKLRSLELTTSKLRTLDLVREPNLEKLIILWPFGHLVELHMMVESLKLKTFDIDVSKLRTLDFSTTPNLELLEISDHDHLVKLQLQVVCSLRGSRDLKLCGNVPEVPKGLYQLERLEMLVSSSKIIKHLPISICMMKHLKVLNLTDCYLLEELPEDLSRLERLEELLLSSKMIKHLPISICMLKHLKVLNLTDCYLLEHLPEDLGRLECLETLNLKNCMFIREIPNNICHMKHLETLSLFYCSQVEKLPEELGRLKCLKRLDIEGAGITHFPQSIFQLKGLLIIGSTWRLESYGLKSITMSCFSRYSAECYI